MSRIHIVTFSLFLIAAGLYLVAPSLGFALFVVGMTTEVLAWMSLTHDVKKGKKKDDDP